MWLHIPAILWGAIVELFNITCPLTIIENAFRNKAGEIVYHADFIQTYLFPLMYPEQLTREIQILLGSSVLIWNLIVYIFILRNKKQTPRFRKH
jgi:hypothetical protein